MTNLIITGQEEEGFSLADGPRAEVSEDGTYVGAKGGTEMMRDRMFELVDNELHEQFHFILSSCLLYTSPSPRDRG